MTALVEELGDLLRGAGLRASASAPGGVETDDGYTSEIAVSFYDPTGDLVDVLECFVYWRGRPSDMDEVIAGLREDFGDVVARRQVSRDPNR